MKQLTPKQLSVLHSIHENIEVSGVPPTIKALRANFNLKSDQGIIELLSRLESNGYIERLPGKARGIKLLPSAYMVLGVKKDNTNDVEANRILNSIERLNVDRLSQIDARLASIYLGGLQSLGDQTNPEYIVHSAHSMREAITYLSNQGKDLITAQESEQWGQKNSGVAIRNKQLERFIDPLRGVAIKIPNNVYKEWNGLYAEFSAIAHHGRIIDHNGYTNLVNRFGLLLHDHILPFQDALYSFIDQTISQGVYKVDTKKIIYTISRNVESLRYFFSKVDDQWFDFLLKNKLLQPSLETAQYLERMATIIPENVIDTILKYRPQDYPGDFHTWRLLSIWIEAANSMPVNAGKKIISKVIKEKWLEKFDANLIARSLIKFLERLIEQKEYKISLNLVTILLALQPERNSGYAISGVLANYNYQDALKKLLNVDVQKLPSFIMHLSYILIHTVPSKRQHTFTLRPAIESNKENGAVQGPLGLLVSSITNLTKKYLDVVVAEAGGVMIELDRIFPKVQDKIILRIKFWAYSNYYKHCLNEIQGVLLKYSSELDTWHEYAILLKKVYPLLPASFQNQYLKVLAMNLRNKKTSGFAKKALQIIHEYLTPPLKKRYKKYLLDTDDSAYFIITTKSYEGPVSPIDAESLSKMSVREVIDYLLASKLEDEERHFFDNVPTVQGMAQILSQDIEKRLDEYGLLAVQFADDQMDPAYTSCLLIKLRNKIQNASLAEWSPVIKLLRYIVGCSKNSAYRNLIQDVARVLEAMVDHMRKGELPVAVSNEIRNLIMELCEYPDPDFAGETYGENSMDPFTMSLNTVRGTSFHALFQYIIGLKGLSKKSNFAIPHNLKTLILKHLDSGYDASLAIRSVYGHYFPWLYYADKAWISDIVELVFPDGREDLFFATWETYLHAVDKEIFGLLSLQYTFALSKFNQGVKHSTRTDIEKDTIEHLAAVYIADDYPNATFYKNNLFKISNAEQRGHCISYIGRHFILPKDSQLKTQAISKLKDLWLERLHNSVDVEELKEFAFWAKADFFDNEWLLKTLIETLKKTNGVISEEFTILEMLEQLSPQYPEMCSQLLLQMVQPVRLGSDTGLYVGAHIEEVKKILKIFYDSTDKNALANTRKITDHLLKLGYAQFRGLNN